MASKKIYGKGWNIQVRVSLATVEIDSLAKDLEALPVGKKYDKAALDALEDLRSACIFCVREVQAIFEEIAEDKKRQDEQ